MRRYEPNLPEGASSVVVDHYNIDLIHPGEGFNGGMSRLWRPLGFVSVAIGNKLYTRLNAVDSDGAVHQILPNLVPYMNTFGSQAPDEYRGQLVMARYRPDQSPDGMGNEAPPRERDWRVLRVVGTEIPPEVHYVHAQDNPAANGFYFTAELVGFVDGNYRDEPAFIEPDQVTAGYYPFPRNF